MRILVTGAAGFLGRHTVGALRDSGHTVCTVSRSRRFDAQTRRIDLTRSDDLSGLPHDLDAVVHLAAHVPAVESAAERAPCFAANAEATLNLLEFAAGRRISHFVYASSIAVYGSAFGGVALQEREPPRPDNAYALSKLAGELLTRPYAFVHGMRVQRLRFSYLYGPGMREDTVVRTFLARAGRGEPLQLRRGGRDRFDLLHVDDAAHAVDLAIASEAGGTFNVASGRSCSVTELARAVLAATGSSSVLEIDDDGAPARTVGLDIGRARGELAWKSRIELVPGLRELAGGPTS